MTNAVRILMCAPDHYEVDYVINPWMEGNIHRSSREQAAGPMEAATPSLEELCDDRSSRATAGMARYGIYGECGIDIG